MAAPLLFALFALLLIAAALVLFGLRGRRINDHPICRQCGFDLHGAYPPAITCSECGAGLKRDGSIRAGARRRRWICLSLGLCLALVPMLCFSVIAYGLAIGANLNRYKPARLLIWEARYAAGPASLELIKELAARSTASTLSDEDTRRAIEVGLELQADPARPWQAEWGDFIEAANADDKIDQTAFKRYLSQSVRVELETRPAVAQGDPIPVLIKLKEARIGSGTQAHALVTFSSARAGGMELRQIHSVTEADAPVWARAILGDAHAMLGWFQLYGAASRMGFMGSQQQNARLLIDSVCTTGSPAPLPQGDHTLELDLGFSVQSASRTTTWTFDDRQPADRAGFKLPLRINPPGAGLRIVEPDPDLSRQVREAAKPATVMILNYGNDDTRYVHLQFHPGRLPVGLAFDVLFKSPEKTWRIGSFVSGRSVDNTEASSFTYGGADDSIERQVQGQIGEFTLDSATIVLRPNPELAKRTLDMDSVYNETLTYEDVPVHWQGDKPTGASKKRRGFLERFLFGG